MRAQKRIGLLSIWMDGWMDVLRTEDVSLERTSATGSSLASSPPAAALASMSAISLSDSAACQRHKQHKEHGTRTDTQIRKQLRIIRQLNTYILVLYIYEGTHCNWYGCTVLHRYLGFFYFCEAFFHSGVIYWRLSCDL